jgi:plasmid stabilization system protein ParE
MTARQFSVHPAAVAEAKDAALWYRQHNSQAAERFLLEYEEALDKIHDAPDRWPPYSHATRRVKTPSFPFLIVYKATESRIQVLAVAHGSRRPGYWKDRL